MADLDETQETADFKSESTERIRQKAREREIVIIDEKLKWNAFSAPCDCQQLLTNS